MFKTGICPDAEDYFSSINSMAGRIMIDTASFQSKVTREHWMKMSYKDKCDMIMREFLQPVIHENYSPDDSPQVESFFPTLKLSSGAKYVVDEGDGNGKRSGYTWRDEHSGPFMWESPSQLDLTLCRVEDTCVQECSTPQKSALTTHEVKTSPKKLPEPKQHEEPKMPVLVADDKSMLAKPQKEKDIEIPVPPPVVVAVQQESKEEKEKTVTSHKTPIVNSPAEPDELDDPLASIPKTGFDFLDNW